MIEKYIVILDRPEGVSIREMKAYLEEAISIWCKSFDPDEPIFDLDSNKVKVSRLKEDKT